MALNSKLWNCVIFSGYWYSCSHSFQSRCICHTWGLLWYLLRKYSKPTQKMLLPCCVDEMGCLMFVLLSSLLFFLYFGQEQLYNTEGNAIKSNQLDKVPWCMSVTSGFRRLRLRPEDESSRTILRLPGEILCLGRSMGSLSIPFVTTTSLL